MKVILLPFTFYPDAAGGSEIYVESLAHHLMAAGIKPLIAVASPKNGTYKHNGLLVRRFATGTGGVIDLRKLYGEGGDMAALEFSKLLDEERPDIVHLHSFTMSHSMKIVRAAKQRKCRVVFTYHVPTTTCVRGTLLRDGRYFCDGQMQTRRCSRCMLQKWKLAPAMANMVGSLPPQVGKMLGKLGMQGGCWTALRASELVDLWHQAARNLMNEADQVIAVSDWVKQLLLLNGVPHEKIKLIKYGVIQKSEPKGPNTRIGRPNLISSTNLGHAPLRIVFLGRLDPNKGIHVLIEAFRAVPGLNAELDIYGISQGEAGNSYEQRLQNLVGSDPRIFFRPPAPAANIVELLRDYDLLAVPSQWLETGPLVVLEAFAAGIPVIGSRLGGIAEMIRDEVNGLLVEAPAVDAWSAGLARLVGESGLMEKLRLGIQPPRTMSDVAQEMIGCYKRWIAT